MSDVLNPMSQVRSSCARVHESAKHVSIDEAAIEEYAESIHSTDGKIVLDGVDWDASGWHYDKDVQENGPLTCQYVFVMDALNFCFWPTPKLEYDTLAVSLKKQLENDEQAFNADRLATIGADELASWFPSELPLPQIDERVIRLREVGQALQENFDGLASNMVKKANGSAIKLVTLILQYFPGFRDTSVYNGRLVHLYKRAQILVGDVWAAYNRRTSPINDNDVYYFYDIDQLTMFADYRVPQILRAMNIMKYNKNLESTIDNNIIIPFGSPEEVEIRACTVIAVDKLQQALLKRGLSLLVIEVDWLLWQRGEAENDAGTLKPHHKTSTIFY
jgi:hypothetical protein